MEKYGAFEISELLDDYVPHEGAHFEVATLYVRRKPPKYFAATTVRWSIMMISYLFRGQINQRPVRQ